MSAGPPKGSRGGRLVRESVCRKAQSVKCMPAPPIDPPRSLGGGSVRSRVWRGRIGRTFDIHRHRHSRRGWRARLPSSSSTAASLRRKGRPDEDSGRRLGDQQSPTPWRAARARRELEAQRRRATTAHSEPPRPHCPPSAPPPRPCPPCAEQKKVVNVEPRGGVARCQPRRRTHNVTSANTLVPLPPSAQNPDPHM